MAFTLLLSLLLVFSILSNIEEGKSLLNTSVNLLLQSESNTSL